MIVFDDVIADMLSNKKLRPVVTDYLLEEENWNFYLVFITKSYFAVPKHIRLNSSQYFFMKTPNKRELQQTAFNHSSDIEFQDFFGYWYYSCIR